MKISKLLLTLPLLMILLSCSSDDGEPGKITLSKDQSRELRFSSSSQSGSIVFTTAASWDACTSKDGRTPEEVDWITLDVSHGTVGESTLSFSIDSNFTGKERYAYIIVTCEDQSVSFKVIQSPEDGDDEPAVLGTFWVRITKETVDESGKSETIEYDVQYSYPQKRPEMYMCSYGEDLYGSTDYYCEVTVFTTFDYDDVAGTVTAETTEISEYYPSGKEETETITHNLAFSKDSNGNLIAQSGSYRWESEDDNPAKFDFTYNSNGYLSQSRNDDGESGKWDVSRFTWSSGNLASISSSYGTIAFDYADASLLNNFRFFDLNWALMEDSEVLDFAAGDVTKIWAICGFLGNPSKNLATAITETDNDNTKYSSRVTYQKHTESTTVLRVERYVNNENAGYSDWKIEYQGNIPQ